MAARNNVQSRPPVVKLRPISDSGNQNNLLQRRASRRSQLQILQQQPNQLEINILNSAINNFSLTSRLNKICHHCNVEFSLNEKMVNLQGNFWHKKCFVCAQCFQEFPDGIFFEYENRRYCKHDFQVLFAPFCAKCKEFIIGRVIKALNQNWHPNCFLCNICKVSLADTGFIKNANRAFCKDCNVREKARCLGKVICFKCKSIIEEGAIKWRGEPYHPYHYQCTSCDKELTSEAREKDSELYCLRCYDKQAISICGACRRPVEERVVHALGKTWHVEHFVCSHCERPFLGSRHYEKRGLAYCELHYHQLFGNTCFSCNSVIIGDVFSALNKSWCNGHFECVACNKKLDHKTKFIEFDLKPVCKNCYKKFPLELVKRQKKISNLESKKK